MSPREVANEPTVCATCGSTAVPRAPFGLCPRCLLGSALNSPEADSSEAAPEALSFDQQEAFDYEILECIGRGGMGVVYRARQRSLDRIVAVKMIAVGNSASPATLARFRREAEMAAKLDHPNIVSIIEVREYQGNPILVMRLIEGESLADRMSSFTPSAAKNAGAHQSQLEIARLMATVSRAVHFAHSRGILHRDLKPSNILLDSEGRPHLTDFGIAKSLDHDTGLTQTAELLGTLCYMPPEQAAGKPAGREADIYSLGAILFELLTGRRLFEGSKMDVLQRVLASEPPSPRMLNPAVERDLATICLKCLEKNPARRYASALSLAEDLERWMRREPILAREAGPLLRVARWTSRYPAVATLLITLFAGIVVSLSLLARAREEQSRKSIALDILRSEASRQFQEIWNSTNSFVAIKSETLSAMAGMEVSSLKENENRFTIALIAEGNPLARVLRAAPMLNEIENSMSALVDKPSRLDLRLYKDSARAVDDLVRREIDFAQLNALQFIRARERDLEIKPLLRIVPAADHSERIVIFSRADTGIKSLADLRGHSLLLGAIDSAVSFRAKVALVQAGVRGADLSKYRYVDRPFDNFPGKKISPGVLLGNRYSSMTPIDALMARFYDASVAREKRFREVAAEQHLIALHTFTDSGDLMAARSDLPRAVTESFRRVIMNQDSAMAGPLLPGLAAHFRPAQEEDYKEVLENSAAAAAFEK